MKQTHPPVALLSGTKAKDEIQRRSGLERLNEPRDILYLLESGSFPAVSIYQPAVRLGRDRRQNPLRLRQALREAEEGLHAEHLFSAVMRRRFAEATSLIDNLTALEHPSEGMTLFLSPQGTHFYWLPFPVEPLITISASFQVKPLLNLFMDNGGFYLLALSQKHAAFFRGDKFTLQREIVKGMPESMAEVFGDTQVDEGLQPHTVGSGPGGQVAMYHGQFSVKESHKKDLQHFFRKVEHAIRPRLARKRIPLLLAGVEYYVPLFRATCDYRNILSVTVEGCVDSLSLKQLHQRAWKVGEPHFHSRTAQIRTRLEEAQATTPSRVLKELIPLVEAAEGGKVEELVLARGVICWGRRDRDGLRVESKQQVGSFDLLDLAALHTLAHGGEVQLVSKEEMPLGATAVGLLRY